MMRTGVSTGSIDYLQRVGRGLPSLTHRSSTGAAPTGRRLLAVRGVGKERKGPQAVPPRPQPGERVRLPTEDLVTGLYGYRIPLAFVARGRPEGVDLQLGVWSSKGATPAQVLDRRCEVLAALLRSLYPSVALEAAIAESPALPLAGLALGVPSVKQPDHADPAAPIDRVIRAVSGTEWAAIVLAHPLSETAVGDIRDGVINEMRAAAAAAKTEGAPSPLTDQYVELLKTALSALTQAGAIGAWRVGVYLLGDGESYPRLASVWRSVFSGAESLPEPVRVHDVAEAAKLAAGWDLPDQDGERGPGQYQHPFAYQTVLTSSQLAGYVHLPENETPGFSVDLVPRFDAVTRRPTADTVTVGKVMHRLEETASDYRVPLKALTRHAFVPGVTGSGKTNTIFALLEQAHAEGVPFLVVEPAKAEYRGLMDHPRLGKGLRVFTAGDDAVGPFRLNPFEVPAGTRVSEHLDLLKAAFSASFGMWTPLPQVLERCLHEVYADRGWDLRTNANRRLGDGDQAWTAFPTLGDLVAKVGEVVPKLGYEERVTADIGAALTTRLESLRRGGKGAMLDVVRSLPTEELFEQPAVLELEAMGDEGDKAFLMGLMLIRLAEHRRTCGHAARLVHLLVIEEAHRLLANVVTRTSEEMANPRGQAVETFANLLSEIRAYGQGVLIADQIPARLAPDVIKNTNLKVAHRVVAEDDRLALAASMAMDEGQARALTILGTGEAAAFSAGDDAPVLVRVPLVKDALASPPPADAKVAKHMGRWRAATGLDELFLARPYCVETCAGAPLACEAGREIVGDDYVQRTVARTVLSTIEEPGALDRMWDDLLATIRSRRPPGVDEDELLRSFAGHAADWYATRRGSQGGWSYADTDELAARLRAVLLDKVSRPAGGAGAKKLRTALQATAVRLHRRTYPPYPACDIVCNQDPPLCLYRSAVADLVASQRYQPSWRDSDVADAGSPDGRRRETWEVCQDAAYELIEFPEPGGPDKLNDALTLKARRTALCFAQQMLVDDKRKVPRTARRVLTRVLGEAGYGA